jgi:protein arginine kinase activator
MKCGQPATHKFTKIDKGQIFDIFLCADHAAEMSPYQKPKIPLSDILEGLLKQDLKLKSTGPAVPTNLRCQTCGLPFEAYRKNLLLGCSDCYASFREFLIPDLRKFHGDTRHYGRQPGGGQARPTSREFSISDLEHESAGMVSKEDVAWEPGVAEMEPKMDPKEQIDELTRVMHKAIAEEDYTKAAICRDQIRDLKSKAKKKTSGG